MALMLGWMLAGLLVAGPLVDAVRDGDPAAVRRLLQQGADVNAREGDGATALHYAVYRDDNELVRVLLDAGASADAANDLAMTPLHLAAANGNAAVVRMLLAKGARPDPPTETGVTPLMEAARAGSADAVAALIARGADVNAAERVRGQTALMWAAAGEHPDVVRVLLGHRANVHARTQVRTLSVMLDQGPRRIVKTAMQDARQIDTGGSTALIFAALRGDAESAKLLIEAGAKPDDAAADGNAALVLAVFSGHTDVARVLIDAGASPDAAGAGYSALHAAALRGDAATVTALLARGADPNARLTRGSPVRRFGSQWALPSTMAGATPLFVAATYLEVDIMRALIAGGADHALGLNDGTTPLLAAAGVAVEKLARPSDLARWNIVDSDSPNVPRDEAEALDALRQLLDAGANVNQANENGDTALHAAAGAGFVSVIQLLADRGATLDVKNKAGLTPLALATPQEGRQAGRPSSAVGSKAAEALLRRLGASR